ncbi:MAG: glycerate kinase type-2 family protein [Candidatus Hodarchaeales archaeon]
MEIKNYSDLVEFPSDKNVIQGRKLLLNLFKSGVEGVNPFEIVRSSLRFNPDTNTVKIKNYSYKLKTENVWVIGVGKAVGRMAEAVEKILITPEVSGIICVPEGVKNTLNLNSIKCLESSHPLPSKKNVINTEKVIDLVKNVKPEDLVISLISGGGSALWASPMSPISLNDLRNLNQELINSGMSIHEINVIRKHISNIKGGRFTQMVPSVNLSMIISDVIGDNIESIASGPFFPDSSTYESALKILEKYDLHEEELPSSVYHVITRGIKGEIEETPKKTNSIFQKVHHFVLGSNKIARKVISEKAEGWGVGVIDKEELVESDARYIGKSLVKVSKRILQESTSPILYLSGGEPIVNVQGDGIGGRNQEVVGGFIEEVLKDSTSIDVALLVAGTDGIDGNSPFAGAISDSYTIQEIRKRKINLKIFQGNNDMTSFFQKVGRSLILSGPTGTNVMDIQMVLVNVSKVKTSLLL